jgi:cell division transport system permease protein
LKRTLKDAGNVLEGLDENPLSASVEIRLNRNVISASKVKSLSTAIKQIAGVDDVYYGEKIAEALHILKTSLHGIGIVMLAVVFAGILFVIYSTVKILFYRKKDEIETLKLLGATALFIRAPFLIEGGLIGLLGGTLGGAAAIALAVILEQRLSTAIPLLKSVVFPIEIAISLPIVGIVLGIAGAIIAVGRLRF